MNTFKGPFRIMFEDLRLQFYILAGVTSFLSILYIILGIFVPSDDKFMVGVSFGPFYGFFLIYPFLFYAKGFKYIISFGGTRKQFLLSSFLNIGLFLVMAIITLNSFYFLTDYLVSEGISKGSLFHMGDLVSGANAYLYPWIDLLWGIIIFSIAFFLSSIWYYFGTLRTMIGLTVFALLAITFITFGDLNDIISFIIVRHLEFVHILAAAGIVMMILSYFIMKNGPLERGKTAGFTVGNGS
ncbi:hypothetical protein [Metabacillus fastidiosus]|uniref:hypothetical protein n=1 Tax=Metabacillus fastidiosus TaxID=1458 RepID=UPI002DBE56B0|nr:hypothetical protein [Metabacillus fastidiosus]MEC2074904.1 hypothetical protein [Metabacillus fastidiosus]